MKKNTLNVMLISIMLTLLLAFSYNIYSLVNVISNYNVNKQFADIAINASAIEFEKKAICRYIVFLVVYFIGLVCSVSAIVLTSKMITLEVFYIKKRILNIMLIFATLALLLAFSYDIYLLVDNVSHYNIDKQFASVASNAALLKTEKQYIFRCCVFLWIYIIGAICSLSVLVIVNKKTKL